MPWLRLLYLHHSAQVLSLQLLPKLLCNPDQNWEALSTCLSPQLGFHRAPSTAQIQHWWVLLLLSTFGRVAQGLEPSPGKWETCFLGPFPPKRIQSIIPFSWVHPNHQATQQSGQRNPSLWCFLLNLGHWVAQNTRFTGSEGEQACGSVAVTQWWGPGPGWGRILRLCFLLPGLFRQLPNAQCRHQSERRDWNQVFLPLKRVLFSLGQRSRLVLDCFPYTPMTGLLGHAGYSTAVRVDRSPGRLEMSVWVPQSWGRPRKQVSYFLGQRYN